MGAVTNALLIVVNACLTLLVMIKGMENLPALAPIKTLLKGLEMIENP